MREREYTTFYGKIHYWVSENVAREKPTLVFLPGLTANHHLFDKQIDHFKEKFNLLVWDPPGHGRSRPFKLEFSLEQKAHWLHDILNKERMEKPFLIGQSMGGYVSQMYIKDFPENIEGFISIDSSSLDRSLYTIIELELLKRMTPVYRYFPWRLLLKTGPVGCAQSGYGRKLMWKMMQDYDTEHLYYAELAGHGFKILAEAIEDNPSIEFKCPVLLICGKKDIAGSTKYYNKKWASKTGFPIKWVRNAGHNSNTDQPKIVNLLIEIFVEKTLNSSKKS